MYRRYRDWLDYNAEKAHVEYFGEHLSYSERMAINNATSIPDAENYFLTKADLSPSGIVLDTSNFDTILSASDDTVQKAFDTLDDHTISSHSDANFDNIEVDDFVYWDGNKFSAKNIPINYKIVQNITERDNLDVYYGLRCYVIDENKEYVYDTSWKNDIIIYENLLTQNKILYYNGDNIISAPITVLSDKLSTDRIIESTVEDGTRPFNILSTTLVEHLNADLLDGHHWSEIPTDTWRAITDTPVQNDSNTSISSAWAYTHESLNGNGGHIPAAGQQGEFLASDGTWAIPDYIPKLTNDEVIAMLLNGYQVETAKYSLLATDTILKAFEKLEYRIVQNEAKNDMVYPGAGIAISTGTSWGTSITDNHANWDDAYSNRITSLTTNGTSGAATLSNYVLNIPVYTYSHDSEWVDKTTLSGATVISNLVVDSVGYVTDWVTRDLTPSDIGAQPAGTYDNYVEWLVDVKSNIGHITTSKTVKFTTDDVALDISYTDATTTVNIWHKDITRTDPAKTTLTPGYSGTFDVVESVTSNAQGHITAAQLRTITLPDAYSHPSHTAYSETLSGAKVLASFSSDALGHVTGLTVRDMTYSDIGAQIAGDYQTHDIDLDEIASLTNEGYLKHTSSWGIISTIPTADLNKAQPFSASILDTWADSVLDDGGDIENLSLYQEDYVTDDDFGISTYNAHQFDVTDGIVNLQADLDILNSITTRTYLGDLVNVTKGLFGGVTDDTVNSLQSDSIIATEYLRAKQRIEFDEYTSTGNPVAGKGWLYAKDGKIYYNNNSGSNYDLTSAGLGDAPTDGSIYGRKDNAWVVVSGTAGSFTGWKWEISSTSYTISDSDVVKLVTATDATASALSIASSSDGADPQTITNTFKLDKDLDVIAALTGTGLLKRTGDGTWILDTSNYVTGGPYDNYGSWNLEADSGLVKSIASGYYANFVGGLNIGLDTLTETSGGKITINHNTFSRADTTSSQSPNFGDTVTIVDSVTTDNGHTTAVNLKTVTLPTPNYTVNTDHYINSITTDANGGNGDVVFSYNQDLADITIHLAHTHDYDNYDRWGFASQLSDGTQINSYDILSGKKAIIKASEKIDLAQSDNIVTVKHKPYNVPAPTTSTTNIAISSLEFDGYGHIKSYTTKDVSQVAINDNKIYLKSSGALAITSDDADINSKDYFTLNQSYDEAFTFSVGCDIDKIASLTGTGFLKRNSDCDWELTSVPSSYDWWELKIGSTSRNIGSDNTVEFLGDTIISPEFTSTSDPFSVTYKHKTYSVSDLSLSGATVISGLTFDGYGHVSATATRNLTLADIGADNYQYWSVFDGTNTGNINSTNILTFLGNGLVNVSYDDTAKSLSFSVEDNDFRKAQSFDFIGFLESMRDDIVSEGGNVENFDLYTEDYLSNDVWGVSTFNKDEFIVVDGMVRLRASYLTDTGTLDTTSTTTLTTGIESFKDVIQLHKVSKTGKFDDLVDKGDVTWALQVNGSKIKDVGVDDYANFVDGTNITISKNTSNDIEIRTLGLFDGTHEGFVPVPTSADSTKYLSGDGTWHELDYTVPGNGKVTINVDNEGGLSISSPNYFSLNDSSNTDINISLDDDLDAIAGLDDTKAGFLKKTGKNTWSLDDSIYDNYFSWKLQVDANTTQDVGSGQTVKFISSTDIKLGQSTRDISVAHDTVSRSNSTSSITPAFGDSFTAIDSIISSTTGHITEINTKTIKLPVPDYYAHPTYTALDEALTGATVLHAFKTDAIGSVTEFTTRELTLEDINAQPAGDYVEQTDKSLGFNDSYIIDKFVEDVLADGGEVENRTVYEEDYIPKDYWGISTFSNKQFDAIDGVVYLKDSINFAGNITAKNLNISNWNTSYGWGDWHHTTLSGYGITDAYTKTEVDGLIHWEARDTHNTSYTVDNSSPFVFLGDSYIDTVMNNEGITHSLITTNIALLDKANTFSKQNTFNEGIFIPNDKIISLGNDYGAVWSDGSYTIIGTSDGTSSTPYLKIDEQYGDVGVINSISIGGSATISGITKVGGHGTVSDPEVINTIYGTNATPPVDASSVPEGTVYIQYQA